MKRKEISILVSLALVITVVASAAVALSTARYKYFVNNDEMLVACVVLLVASAIAAVLLRRSALFKITGVLFLLIAFFISRQYVIHVRCQRAIASCANHMHHICSPFTFWIEMDKPSPDTRLPKTTEFQDFLDMLATNGYPRTEFQWCAGHKLSDQKTGYVYVGGGLTLKTVVERQPLIAFCAFGCHPYPYDHQHALIGTESTPDCRYTDSMIQLLTKTLAQAEAGEIPYSSAAVDLMRKELEKRQKWEKKSFITKGWNIFSKPRRF